MAIVKNTRNSDTAITLRVFRKNTNIKSLIPDAGQYVTAMYPKYYLQLNNSALGDASGIGYMPRIWAFQAGDGFIIRAEISANASGPFWGGVSTDNNSLSITKIGNAVMWVFNGDAIASVTYQSGIHDYGFIGFEVNGVKYSQAYYDGEVVSDSSPENFSDVFPITLIGGFFVPNEDPQCIHGSDYGIRVYDAIAETSEGSWHLYPYNEVDSASGGGMFETLNRNGSDRCKRTMNGSSAGGTSSVSVGEFPSDISGIGLQLPEDLRAITGSGYFDLIPLMFEDGGIDTLVGWNSSLADTNPSKVSEPNQPDKYFAFYIGLSSDYTNIPLPNDDCTATKGGSTSYAIGELIRGRKPKWNIWNDQIRFGKYAITLGSGARKVYFNIFYDNYGVNQDKFDLENMENYNTATYHAPKIGMSGTLNFEYHNGYCCRITEAMKLTGGKTATDRASIFIFNRESGGIGNVKLGNLPLWNYTETEQNQGAQTGLANLQACGAGLRITCQGASGVKEIALMCKSVKDTGDMDGNDPIPFCTGSNAATKAMFRDNGFDCTSIISDKSIEFMRDLLYTYTTRKVWAELIMTKNTSDSPTENAQIDCTNLVPKEESTANGIFDSNVYPTKTGLAGTNNDRFVVGEVGGVCKIGSTQYQIGIIGNSAYIDWGGTANDDSRDLFNYLITYMAPDTSHQPYGRAIAIGIGLKDASNNLLSIVGTGSTPIMAFAVVTAQNASTGGVTSKMFGFTKIVSVVWDATNNNYLLPLAYDYRYWENKIQPWGINGDGNSSNQTKRGAAFFMWKDLKMNRNVNTSRPTDGVTCHMKVFAQNSGVHAWMPYLSANPSSANEGEAYFDDISENYHSWLNGTIVKDVYFHNSGELLENSILGSSNFIDVWMTLWNTTGNPHVPRSDTQVTAANALDGKTLTLYEEVLHEPKDSASGAAPVELCHFTFNSSASYVTGKDSDNQDTDYHLYMQSGQTAPFFSRLPINSSRYGEFENTGFYHLWITNSAIQPSTGSMYYIKIT